MPDPLQISRTIRLVQRVRHGVKGIHCNGVKMNKKTVVFYLMLFLVFNYTLLPVYAYRSDQTGEYFENSFKYESQGNYAAALNSVLLVLRMDRGNYTATLRAGWLNYLKKNYKDSIRYYKKTVALEPDAIEPKLGLMLPLMASKMWHYAETTARAVLAIDPKNYTGNSRLAYILFSQTRYGEAEKQYGKVLQWYPGDIEMKLGLAWSNLHIGRKEVSEKYFREVIQVRKSNTSALAGMETIGKLGNPVNKTPVNP